MKNALKLPVGSGSENQNSELSNRIHTTANIQQQSNVQVNESNLQEHFTNESAVSGDSMNEEDKENN